jgi:hypothetical protein
MLDAEEARYQATRACLQGAIHSLKRARDFCKGRQFEFSLIGLHDRAAQLHAAMCSETEEKPLLSDAELWFKIESLAHESAEQFFDKLYSVVIFVDDLFDAPDFYGAFLPS